MPLIVGLTGGIGSGKSTAAKQFAELGAAIIDTDEIAHRLTAPGTSTLAEIFRQFGDGYRLPDGGLDRGKLRQLVFSQPEAKQKLEAILHPRIRQEVIAALGEITAPYAIVVVPLLLETGGYQNLVQRTLVVDCDEVQQVARATNRSRLSPEIVEAIMANQFPRAERLRQADDVLENRNDLADLERQIQALHKKYLELAGASA